MHELDHQFEEEFSWISEHAPKELVRERSTKQGTTREFGPFVYGYSVTIGPDGKPIIREFGNIKPALPVGRPVIQLKSEREPTVDVMQDEKQIKVIAELPGVKKEDILVSTKEDSLTLRVEGETRKYFKEVELPTEVEPNSAKATYVNGVLEITLNKKKPVASEKGFQIEVE
jgi:HSP20 family protein